MYSKQLICTILIGCYKVEEEEKGQHLSQYVCLYQTHWIKLLVKEFVEPDPHIAGAFVFNGNKQTHLM